MNCRRKKGKISRLAGAVAWGPDYSCVAEKNENGGGSSGKAIRIRGTLFSSLKENIQPSYLLEKWIEIQ
jgi:hypothetical protein